MQFKDFFLNHLCDKQDVTKNSLIDPHDYLVRTGRAILSVSDALPIYQPHPPRYL